MAARAQEPLRAAALSQSLSFLCPTSKKFVDLVRRYNLASHRSLRQSLWEVKVIIHMCKPWQSTTYAFRHHGDRPQQLYVRPCLDLNPRKQGGDTHGRLVTIAQLARQSRAHRSCYEDAKLLFWLHSQSENKSRRSLPPFCVWLTPILSYWRQQLFLQCSTPNVYCSII